jgi:hypothetical protein
LPKTEAIREFLGNVFLWFLALQWQDVNGQETPGFNYAGAGWQAHLKRTLKLKPQHFPVASQKLPEDPTEAKPSSITENYPKGAQIEELIPWQPHWRKN